MNISICSCYAWPSIADQAWKCKTSPKGIYKACWRLYDRHSDVISSVTILGCNTILLASKILARIPVILPRMSLVLLNYTGIIWINIQIQSLHKSVLDLSLAIRLGDPAGVVLSASKVAFKALNVFLTAAMFGASLINLAGFPATTLAIYFALRPLAMAGWFVGIANECSDYYQNRILLREFYVIEKSSDRDVRIQLIVRNFVEMVTPACSENLPELPADMASVNKYERFRAMRIIRQCPEYALTAFKDNLRDPGRVSKSAGNLSGLGLDKMNGYFQSFQSSISTKQNLVRANFGLIGLGYICLGIGRMYPDTIAQYTVYWGMSVLYTGKLVYQKYLQARLKKGLS